MPKTMKKRVDKKQDKEIAVLKKQVKALGKTVERKYIDKVYYQQSTGPLTTNDSVFPINAIAVFNGNNALRHQQRQGQTINMRSYKIRGTINLPPFVLAPEPGGTLIPPPISAEVRMMLVLFPENQEGNATTIDSADILQFRAAQPFNSYNKIDGSVKYQVLYDKVFRLQNSVSQVPGNPTLTALAVPTERNRIPFNINVKFGKSGKVEEYMLNQGSNSVPVKNRLVLFAWSDYFGPNIEQAPYIEAMSRFRFDDV